MSNNVSSSYSSFTGTIGKFEGVTTLSTMIESSFASIKTKRVVKTMW
jgi:hypothetical protein